MDRLDLDSLFNSFKQNLLSYLFVLQKEFQEANEFINTLRNYEPFKLDVRESTPEQNALNIAVVISYARNFKKNYGFYNTNEINSTLTKDYDDKEKELHRTIIKCRDTEYAHSDASSHDVQIDTEDMFSHSLKVVRQLLEKNEVQMLSQMVNKVRKRIDEQINYIKNY